MCDGVLIAMALILQKRLFCRIKDRVTTRRMCTTLNQLGTFAALLLLCSLVNANTSSVFSPDVKAGTSAFEYRGSYEPEEGDTKSAFSQRLHFQMAFDDTWRGRIIGAQSRSNGNDLEYSYTRLELQQQVLEDERHGWDSALRYELQISDREGRPDRFRLAWTGKWDLSKRWQGRANVLLGREFGDNRGSGVIMETRAQISSKLGKSGTVGLQMYNDLNRNTEMGSFDEQEHQLGPFYKLKFGSWSINARYLFGVSDSAPDDNIGVHIIWAL